MFITNAERFLGFLPFLYLPYKLGLAAFDGLLQFIVRPTERVFGRFPIRDVLNLDEEPVHIATRVAENRQAGDAPNGMPLPVPVAPLVPVFIDRAAPQLLEPGPDPVQILRVRLEMN